jgi:hypothetical protein
MCTKYFSIFEKIAIMEKIFPIEIGVRVGEKAMRVMIFYRKDESRISFFVRFSDGYEDTFRLTGEKDELIPVGTKNESEAYAVSLWKELRNLKDFVDGQFVKHFVHLVGRLPVNVYLAAEPGDEVKNVLYVYYGGECRFAMRKGEKGWERRTEYSGNPVTNDEIMKAAPQFV